MIIVGLTGSIGMGKSATAQMFRDAGVPVYDADAAVHRIYAPGGSAVAPIEAAFPGVTAEDGSVDRIKLRSRVIDDGEAMKRLEEIVHPLVRQEQTDFMDNCRARNADIVVLDIPLIYETGAEDRMDVVVVVSAPAETQRERVLARPGMTADAFESILAKQVPDTIKRQKADFVIDTNQGFDHARRQVHDILNALRAAPGEATLKN